MNHLLNLIKKELRELITPASMMPVIVVMIMFIALGTMMGSEISEKTSLQPVGYIDMTNEPGGYADSALTYLAYYYEAVYQVDPSEYLKDISSDVSEADFEKSLYDAMINNKVSTALYIDKDFNTHIANWETEKAEIKVFYAQEDTGVFSSLSTAYGTEAVSVINRSVMNELLEENTTLTPIQISSIESSCYYSNYTYLKGQLHENVTPDKVYGAISSQTTFVPIIIMLVIVMIGSIIISSIGNEKENKTLETLLTLPINRTTIVTGKLIGSAIAGLVMCAFYMVGMYFYINGMSITKGGLTVDDLGISLGIVDWLIVAAMMFLTIMCALGICMLLGAFAKNYKTAQMYLMPVSALAVIPMFVTMFANYFTLPPVIQGLLFVIPFTHPMMVIQNLMFDEYALVYAGLAYVAIFAVVVVFLTVKLYKSDILLTGMTGKYAKLFSKQKETEQ